jgi:hypothetical protein
MSRRLRGVHTALPAIVNAYDPATQLATVTPTVEIEIAPDDWDAIPPLTEVPVLFPRGGGFYCHFPLAAGDHVLLVFAEQDPSAWFDKGSAEPPALLRRHGFYPFAIPGAFPRAGALAGLPAGAAAIGKAGGDSVSVNASGVFLGSPTATDFVALASRVDAELAKIKTHTHGVTAAEGAPTLVSPELTANLIPFTASPKVRTI